MNLKQMINILEQMKGQDASLNNVGQIVLVLLVIGIVFVAASGTINQTVDGLVGNVSFPDLNVG